MKRKIHPIQELWQYKKSNVAVFLGSGISIRDITDEQWKKIFTYDVWTVNNWVYHPSVVPHFYHIELKYYDFDIVKRRFLEKHDQYKNTKFIIPENKPNLADALPLDFPYIFSYKFVHRNRLERKCIDANYDVMDSFVITKNYEASLTSMLEIMYRFGYEKIILYGVDMNNSYYFWTGGDLIYGEVHHQTNKEHEGKDPHLPHQTHHIKDFIIDFNQRFMLTQNREIFVGSTKSALYPNIKFTEIMEFKNG
jgi:hypothetical protein